MAFTDLIRCTRGAIAVITALVFPLLLGFASLGVEVGHWYLGQRQMQGAADAAAISAAAQYIQDQIAGSGSSTYQTVGQSYASLNGFTIPAANVCLIAVDGDNCSTARSLDSRPIVCSAPPCIVVEITQNTAEWLTTQLSLEPNTGGSGFRAIPTPTLTARAVVSVEINLSTPTSNSCILTLANKRNAIQVRGNGDIHADCGLQVDGGRAQNVDTTTTCSDGTAPPCGGLTLSGANAMVHVTRLTVASSTAGPAESSCPDPSRCFLYNPATTTLPTSAIFTNTATPDPFADRIFTKPTGQVITGVALTARNGYTGTSTFTVQGGTGNAVKFKATISNSGISGSVTIVDPGQYTALPANPVRVKDASGNLIAATFTLTPGNCFPGAQFAAMVTAAAPVPGRAYCSIPAPKIVNFPTGIYYIEGGDATCVGLCIQTGGQNPPANVTSDPAGATFVLTNVGTGTTGPYARMTISSNGTVNLVAPANNINADGTPCASGCANTTFGMIVFQDRNAPETPSLPDGGLLTGDTTLNSMSGCGNNADCRTLSGSLYFPKQTLNFSGNGTVHGTCFGLVSKFLDDAGTPIFQNGCLPGSGGTGGTGGLPGGTFKLAQ